MRIAALRRYVIGGAVIGMVGVIVLAIAQHGTTHASWSVLLKIAIGKALVERIAALASAAVIVLIVARSWSYALAIVAAAGAMLADVHAGHADATYSWIGGPPLEMGVQWVHFAAAAVWMGGLGALLVAIKGNESEDKAQAVLRYARFAAVSIFVVAASGVYRAIGAIGSWHGLFHSGYGYLVIAKAVLLGLLSLLAIRQRFFNLDKVRTTLRGLRRAGKAELAIGTSILVATAILLGLSPPPPVLASSAPLTADGTDLGHVVNAHLVVTPGQAGLNTFTVTLKTSERPDSVALRFAYASGNAIGPSELQLRRHGNAWRATAANLSIQGLWNVTVVTQGATNSAEVPLMVATHCETQASSGGQNLTLYTQTLAGGNSDSMYLDPGRPGRNEIHFTFFDPKGNELAIPDAPAITAWRPNTSPRGLAVRRFSAGHFIASGRLGRGRWRFEADASPKGTSQPLRACFEQTI
jgi:putative copper export protein